MKQSIIKLKPLPEPTWKPIDSKSICDAPPRTIVIGDIHGAVEALIQVIDRVKYRPGTDTLVFIGDYVDGWSDNFLTCHYILDLYQKNPDKVILLMGNHDKWVKDALNHSLNWFTNSREHRMKMGQAHIDWFSNGGVATYNDFIKYQPSLLNKLRYEFFNILREYYYDEERNILYVHGGFSPSSGFETTKKINRKDLLWNRQLYKRALHLWHLTEKYGEEGPKEETKKLGGFDRIYIGHTSTCGDQIYEPTIMCNVVNVDQGAGWYGRLTAYIHETDTFVQSDRVADLYNIDNHGR